MAAAKAAQFEREESEAQRDEDAGCTLTKAGEQHGSTLALNKRSMVLDEEVFEEQFLRCQVCKERFTAPHRMPRLLPCHHSFCAVCISQLYWTQAQHRTNLVPAFRAMPSAVSIQCPACRASLMTSEENLHKLPTDHRVVQLMDFVRHTDRYTVTFCSKHRLQPLNFFCEPCVRPVCRDCTVLDHKEQEGHLVMDLETALDKYGPVLEKAVSEMESEAVLLEEKRIALDSALKTLDKQRGDLLEQLHGTFNALRQALTQREQDLERALHGQLDKERDKLREKGGQLSARRKTLLEHADTLKTARQDVNVEEMFRVHQQARDYRAGPPIKVREVDEGLLASFSFNLRDDALLASRLANFGEVTSRLESLCPRVRSLRHFTLRSTSATVPPP